ncbi:MAG: tetratricopeptide repeat protein [Flavobacteriales bacterium]|nr:tetratricopeptide repeat protein [Flavobacteriales bacterium]
MGRREDREKKKAKEEAAVTVAKSSVPKLIYAVIAVFALLLYYNTFEHDYVLDDDVIIRANRHVQSGLEGIPLIFKKGFYHGFNNVNEGSYRPMILLNMAIEKEYWGNDPKIGHMFNVFWYAVSCLLLFSFLRNLLTDKSWHLPLIITLLYVAHPIHTEVVANIKSRDEILCFMFIISSLNLLLLHIKKGNPLLLAGSLVLYLLSLLTKEYGITLIAVIPFMLYIFTSETTKNIAKHTVYFVAIAGLYFIIRSNILDNLAFEEEMDVINNCLVSATNYSDRLATTILILGKYLVLLVFPHPLSFDYSLNQIPIVSWTNLSAIAALLAHAGLAYVILRGIKTKNAIAFGILFYLVTVTIVSNLFVEIGASMAERFMFTPSLGFVIVLALGLAKLIGYDSDTQSKKVPYFAVMGLIIALYSYKTIDRNADWQSNLTLFEADVLAAPNSARTHFSLASTYNTMGGLEQDPTKKLELLNKAIVGFNKSLEIYPEYSAAWYNMGVAYYSMNDQESALTAYVNTLAINPNDKQAYNNAGVIYFNRKDYDTALEYFLNAVRVNPSFPDAYANIGAVYHNRSQYEDAIVYYEKAIALKPDYKMVLGNLAKVNKALGNNERAAYYSQKAQ